MTAISRFILTGFLGSGKTTLLRALLADPALRDTAVLINEFGEVGLDHLLVRAITDEIVLLRSGCVCCMVRDDLVSTLDELGALRAAGEIPAFGRVAVETTGLADPAPIVHTLMDERLGGYRLGAIIATVDAINGQRQLDAHAEARKQAAIADRLVVTKIDLAPDARLALRERLQAINPGARLLESTPERSPPPAELFAEDAFRLAAKSSEVRRWLADEAGAISSYEGAHRHDERISTFCIFIDEPVAWDTFTQWLELLLTARGDQILRVKGLLDVAGEDRPLVIQGVQHVFYPPERLDAWPEGDRRSRLVFITQDLSRRAVENSLRAVFGASLRLSATQGRSA